LPISRLAALVALAGCLQTVPLGPDLGPCSEPPRGQHTFGEIGIGTCLAGPTDLQFMTLGGRTWLVIANADPYYAFTSGSVLLVDFDAIDTTRALLRMDELTAFALPTDRLIGGLALVEGRPDGVPLLLTPTRASPEDTFQAHPDDLLVFDVSDPTKPVPWAGGARVTVGQNPYHVAVVDGRAFVLNLTGQDISVLDVHATPLEPMRLRGVARLDRATFHDDGSGAVAELAAWAVSSPSRVPSDRWVLTWLDHSWRAWLPTPDGLHRWNGGDDAIVVAPTGVDVPRAAFPAPLTGPFAFTLLVEDLPVPALAFGSGGNLYTAFAAAGLTGWLPNEDILLRGDPRGGWAAWLDAPSRFTIGGVDALAFEAREDPDARGAIGVALSTDGVTFSRISEPVLAPPPGLSYEHPIVRSDPFTGGVRAWMTVRDGAARAIFHSRSADARAWSAPEPVTGLPLGAASPVVSRLTGRYVLWFVVPEGDAWWLARAISDDGLRWRDVAMLRPLDGVTSADPPPRPAIQPDPIGGFTVRGDNAGQIVQPSIYARDGVGFDARALAGFTFRVATGHALPLADLPATATNGTIPGAVATIGGRPTLYATTRGADGREHLAAFALDADPPTLLAADLVPLDAAGLSGARSPVVFGDPGAYTLLFATTDARGRPVVRRATSPDGLAWALDADPALVPPADLSAVDLAPGSVQRLSSGELRLWYGAFDGARWRVAAARTIDAGRSFTPEPGADGRAFQVGPGLPGTLDDGGVSAPRFFVWDDQPYLATSAFDGVRWSVGLLVGEWGADRNAPPAWARRADGRGTPSAWIPALGRSFADAGTSSPVVWPEGERLTVWFAGHDVERDPTPRLGVAHGDPTAMFPAMRTPTAGSALTFRSRPGGVQQSTIRLNQVVESFATDGSGLNSMTYDAERGFLYVTSRNSSFFYVIDVRDDSTRTFDDANFLDLEGIVQLRGVGPGVTLREVATHAGGGALYASARQPDGVIVIDGERLTDGSTKRTIDDAALHVFPMVAENRLESPIFDPFAFALPSPASAAGLAVRSGLDGDHLFASHFADNSVSTFDLNRGAYGAQVAYAGNLGARPHVVRVSPDGRFAVVASYQGDVEGNEVSSTLSILDADPASPTFGRLLTTLVNR
jgi:hypothetical protein